MNINIGHKIGFITGVIISILFLSCFTIVSQKEAAFKIRKSGNYRGIDSLPLVSGLVFYIPLIQSIETISTTSQHVVWSEGADEGSKPNQHITVGCLGGAGFKMDVGLNYSVIPHLASKIWLKYKITDLSILTDQQIRSIVRGTMNEISGTITVDSMLNNFPLYENECFRRIESKLLLMGIKLDNFNIIKLPEPSDPDLAKSIKDKIKAKQISETKKIELQGTLADNAKQVSNAKADSASKVIRAAGEAKAANLIKTQLSPIYVDYLKWSTASPNLPRVPNIVGGNPNYWIK